MKRKRIAIFIVLMIGICLACQGCNHKADYDNGKQLVEGIYEGRLLLLVETDKSVYQYDDYIYVTATMLNFGDEDIRILMPAKKRGIHQELVTTIENGSSSLIDVDMYWYTNHEMEEGEFILESGDNYVQNMRFSTQTFQGGVGNFVKTDNPLESGVYRGSVCANIVTEEGVEKFVVEFNITIGTDN